MIQHKLNKEKSFQIILPSDVIALRFVFVSARSDKMQQNAAAELKG